MLSQSLRDDKAQLAVGDDVDRVKREANEEKNESASIFLVL